MKELEAISGDVVDVALRLHRELGPGLLESVYEMILAARLEQMGYRIARQRAIDITFDGLHFPAAFRIDILVDERLLVEVKSVERLSPAHGKQLLTYLRIMDLPVGLLINFGAATLKEGLHRIVNSRVPLRLCASA